MSKVASGSDGWLYLDDVFILLCCIEIQAELDVSELNFVVARFCCKIQKSTEKSDI